MISDSHTAPKKSFGWIESLPSGWSECHMRWLAKLYAGGTPDKSKEEYWADGSIPWLNSGSVNQGLITEASAFISEQGFNNSSARWVPEGALVMALAGQGKTKGMVAQMGMRATCNQSMAAIEPYGINARFLFYWLTSNYRRIRSGASDDLRDGLNLQMLGDIPCPVPENPSEQQRIVNFLDDKTARIDALIAEKERLLVALDEFRGSIVTEAVTRGLNPKVSLVDSSTEWLGKIPAHWTRPRLGHLLRQVSDGPHFSPDYVEEGFPFLSARNIKVDRWSLDDVKYIDEDNFREFSKRIVPERGDVLYTKGGTTGIARYIDLDIAFQVWVHIAVLKLRQNKVDGRFLAHSLNSRGCYAQSQLYTYGATNNDFGLTRMVRVVLALPPLSEQREIATYLDTKSKELYETSEHVTTHIARLREYRSSLISAAVTGQMDIGSFKEAA